MIVQLSHLQLSHRDEPIIEYDSVDRVVVTHFRGLKCFPNYWDLLDLDLLTVATIMQIVSTPPPDCGWRRSITPEDTSAHGCQMLAAFPPERQQRNGLCRGFQGRQLRS